MEACRAELNNFIPDVYIYTDHFKGDESGLSPGYGISLVAETVDGCLLSAERMAEKATLPEELGGLRGEKWFEGRFEACKPILVPQSSTGKHGAHLLFEEIWRGGTIDTQSQAQCLLMMVLGPEVRFLFVH